MYLLHPLDLYFAMPWAGLNRLARPFMGLASPIGAEPVLKEFANAGEMRPGGKLMVGPGRTGGC